MSSWADKVVTWGDLVDVWIGCMIGWAVVAVGAALLRAWRARRRVEDSLLYETQEERDMRKWQHPDRLP